MRDPQPPPRGCYSKWPIPVILCIRFALVMNAPAAEATKTPAPGVPVSQSERKAFKCPGCGATLYSVYHTVCPVCAEPIALETLEQALGVKADVMRGGSGIPWSLILTGLVIVVALIIVLAIR